jgi:hypothetical protein
MAARTTVDLIVAPRHQLGVVNRQLAGCEKIVPPVAAQKHAQTTHGRENQRTHKPSSLRTQRTHRHATVVETAFAVGRWSRFASSAALGRTIANPAVAFTNRMTGRRLRTISVTCRPQGTRRTFFCLTANPVLIGPFISFAIRLERLSHVPPPSKRCVSQPCRHARITSG